MKVDAAKEQIDRLYPAEILTIDRPILEKIENIDSKAGEIIFRSVVIENITPYGTGSSV